MATLLTPYINQLTAQGDSGAGLDLFTNYIGDATVDQCAVRGLPSGITVDADLVTQGSAKNENATYMVEVVVKQIPKRNFYFSWVIGEGGTLQGVGGSGSNRTAISRSIYD